MIKTVKLYGGKVVIAFEPEQHIYTIAESKLGHFPGARIPTVPGVTTVLGVLNKPALIQWAANGAIVDLLELAGCEVCPGPGANTSASLNIFMEHFKNEFPEYYKNGNIRFASLSLEHFDKARYWHKKYKEEQGEEGSDAHEKIAQILSKRIGETTGKIAADLLGSALPSAGIVVDPSALGAALSFFRWCALNPDFRVVASERIVFSAGLFFAGTMDLMLQATKDLGDRLPPILKGDYVVSDFKTSKSVYREHRLQVSGYAGAINEESGGKVSAHRAIHHLHKNGDPATFYNYGAEDYDRGAVDFGAFLNCLMLSNWTRGQ